MVNYMAITENKVFFSKENEMKNIKKDRTVTEAIGKLMKCERAYGKAALQIANFLQREIPVMDEEFDEVVSNLDIDTIVPIYYTFFNRDQVVDKMKKFNDKKCLPILIEGESIYIGPLTNNINIFNDFIIRLISNDLALKEKYSISKNEKADRIFFNKNVIEKNKQKINEIAKSMMEDNYENEVWIIEGENINRHVFQPFHILNHQRNKDLLSAVDDKLGIVTEVKTESLKEYGVDIYVSVSTTTDYPLYGNSMFAQSNSGAGFDEVSAQYSAVGESIERLAGGAYEPYDIQMSKAKDLKGKLANIKDFILFSDEQYKKERFPYKKLGEDVNIRWSQAMNLCTSQQEYLPLAFIKLPYKVQEGEERISPAISTGLALGGTKEQAILSGFYEVIERDAFALSWFLKLPPNKELNIDEYVECQKMNLSKQYVCRAYDISVQGLLNTVAVVILDTKSNHFMIGAATRFTIAEAIKKAFLEATQGITYVNMLVRKYKNDDLISDFNKIDTFQKHAAFYSIYPEMKKKVGYLLDENYQFTERNNSNFEADANLSDKEKINMIIELMKKKNKSVYYIDMTTPELQNINVSAARVIVPGMQPLHGAHKYRFLDDRRMREIGEVQEINQYPHPFP